MKAIQLHDKYTEDVIGTVLVRDKANEKEICEAWDSYQEYNNSNGHHFPEIWHFVNQFPKLDLVVLEIEVYQP